MLVGSQTGMCTALGSQLVSAAAQQGVSLELQSLLDYEPEQLLQEKVVLLVLSTYEEGTPPTSAKYAKAALQSKPNISQQQSLSAMLIDYQLAWQISSWHA